MALVLDPDKPPCPWCLHPFGWKQALWHEKTAYCPSCRRCVVKKLSHTLESGVLSAGWHWGKHPSHEREVN